jgi:hypothetical protein
MSVNYQDLKIGETYFILEPESEKVVETFLEEIHCNKPESERIRFTFEYEYLDLDSESKKSKSWIYLRIENGEEVDQDFKVPIIPYKTREEAESNRARLLEILYQNVIQDNKKEVAEYEEKIRNLKTS